MIMNTESRPGWDAKNRFNLPFVLPLDWKVFGDAIRAFYGLKDKGNGGAKEKSQPMEKPAQNGQERSLLAKVRERLEQSNISEPEFLDILKAAQIPEAQSEATSLESIPDKPLKLSLESWDTVTALAEELRARETEAREVPEKTSRAPFSACAYLRLFHIRATMRVMYPRLVYR
jgi:hypothetical protein